MVENGTYGNSVSFAWAVSSPITITQPSDQATAEGGTASLAISASGGGTLRYAAVGLPPGLVINATTGAISGTVSAGAAANGPYWVTVGVNDGTYSARTTFLWDVTNPISITAPGDQSGTEGASVSLTISAAGSGTLSYSATGLPNGLSINSGTGAITGTLSDGGLWQPSVTVSNGTYSNSITFEWVVESPISISYPGYQASRVGDSVSLAVSASGGGTKTYSASGLPTGLSINSSTGVISGTVGSGASTTTPYTATVTVTDGTNSAVETFIWAVSQAGPVVVYHPGNQASTVGDQLTLLVRAEDLGHEALRYTATGLPAGLSINTVTGLIFGTLSSGATTGSPHTVTVTAADPQGNSNSQAFTWSVSAAGALRLANPGDQTSSEGGTVSLSLSTTYSGSGTVRYAALGLPPGLSMSTSTGAISGTVAVGANGSYDVTVLANDDTYSAAQTFLWTVNNPITLAQPADQSSNENDSVSLSLSASGGGTKTYAALGLPPGLAINPSTGSITGTVARGAAASGPYNVTVVAEDGTSSATRSFTWDVGSPISVAAPADQSDADGDSVSLSISATGSGTLSYAAVGLPAGLAINSSTGAITGTVAVGASGLGWYFPTITVSNGTYSSTVEFLWDVSSPVTISSPRSQTATVGDAVSLQVQATGSGTLTYAASGLPTGLSINTATGLISGTVSSGAGTVGSFATRITVGNGTHSATDSFTWVVSAAGSVTMTTPANQSSAEGASVSLSISASGSGTLKYFAAGLPAGLSINPSTGGISGTIAVNDSAFSPYSVTVFVTNGTNGAWQNFTWVVSGAVGFSPVADQTSAEGASVSLTVSATYSGGGTLRYGAVGLPGGLSINTSTGAITGTVAAGTSTSGVYFVTVTAGDGTFGGAVSFAWTIGGPITLTTPADRANLEGDAVSISLGVSYSGGGTLAYTASGLPGGLQINTATGAITGTIAVGECGYHVVAVTASDGTSSATRTFSWTVGNPISITDPGTQQVGAGDTVSLQIGVVTSLGGTLTYLATGLPGGLSINAATGLISGTIGSTADAAGVFASSVAVSNGTYSAIRTFVWNVVAPTLGLGNAAPGGNTIEYLPLFLPWVVGEADEDGPKPKSYWVAKANEAIAGYDKDLPPWASELTRAIARNRHTNGLYATAYMENPKKLPWVGLAVYASSQVGDALRTLKDEIGNARDKLKGTNDPRAIIVYTAAWKIAWETAKPLAEGNKAVFDDNYWQVLAFRGDPVAGLAQLKYFKDHGELTGDSLDAWTMIVNGEQQGNTQMMVDGNLLLFHHEQRDVLQPYFDQFPWFPVNVGEEIAKNSTPLFPGATPFGKVGTNVVKLDQRWDAWIVKKLWPEWLAYSADPATDRCAKKVTPDAAIE